MAEYTYKDVIIDPEDPRVEIGAKYYFALGAQACIDYANSGRRVNTLDRLDKSGNYNPFIADEKDYPFIIRKKEPTYEERQAEWVKANNIKVGSKVKILRGFKPLEGGVGTAMTIDGKMDALIGTVGEILSIRPTCIGVMRKNPDGQFFWPYFVLEKVEEPKFKVGDFVRVKGTEIVGMIIRKSEKGFHIYQNNPYSVAIPHDAGELEPIKAHLKPFDLKYKDTRNMLRAEWIRPKNGEEMDEAMIVGFHSYEKEEAIDLCISCDGFLSPKDALSLWCFLDGSPCGIVVEDKDE